MDNLPSIILDFALNHYLRWRQNFLKYLKNQLFFPFAGYSCIEYTGARYLSHYFRVNLTYINSIQGYKKVKNSGTGFVFVAAVNKPDFQLGTWNAQDKSHASAK